MTQGVSRRTPRYDAHSSKLVIGVRGSDLLGRHGSRCFVLIRRPCHSFRPLHFSQQRRRSVYRLDQLKLNNGVFMFQLWTVPSVNLLLLLLLFKDLRRYALQSAHMIVNVLSLVSASPRIFLGWEVTIDKMSGKALHQTKPARSSWSHHCCIRLRNLLHIVY